MRLGNYGADAELTIPYRIELEKVRQNEPFYKRSAFIVSSSTLLALGIGLLIYYKFIGKRATSGR